MNKKYLIGLIVIGVIAVSALALVIFRPAQITQLGGSTFEHGISITDGDLTVVGKTTVDTFTQGGGVYSTSTTATAVPLLASYFDTENMIDVTLNVASATLSFPATSTLTSFIPNTGDTRTLFVRNATTTAAVTLTVSGGTGVLLKVASSTKVILGDTDGANFGKFILIRKANTDIEALFDSFSD